MNNLKRAFTVGFSAGIAWVLISCHGNRVRERYDEETLNQEENHYNLYKHEKVVKTIPIVPEEPERKKEEKVDSDEQKERMYTYSQFKGLAPFDRETPELPRSFSVLEVCWRGQAPILRFWQRYFSSRSVAFSCPLDKCNTKLISEDKTRAVYDVVVSLRQGTLLPWFIMDDYELFMIRVVNDKTSETWRIEKVTQLTDNREDDIQPVVSPQGDKLVFTTIEDDTSKLHLIRLDSTGHASEPVLLDENSMLPFFIDDSERLLYVKKTSNFRDFHVLDFTPSALSAETKHTAKQVPANSANSQPSNTPSPIPANEKDIMAAIRLIPYSSLKEKYMLIKSFENKTEAFDSDLPCVSMDFEKLSTTGLRNSPAILSKYYKYEGASSEALHNLFDQGPDFFFGANYMAAENIFTDTPVDAVPIGDRIATEGFLRLLTGLSIPVIPNVPLRLATAARDRWQEEESRREFHQKVNETTEEIIKAYFDYIEHDKALRIHREILRLSEKRLAVFQKQAALGFVVKERVGMADSALAAAQSDYNSMIEHLIYDQFNMASRVGLNLDKALLIQYPENAISSSLPETPSLEWFQAQGQINHPEIQRLDFSILKTAAIRDMGPPVMRTDGVKVQLTYGLGFENWSKAVDDFLQVSTINLFPLRLPIVGNAYYDQWSSEIASLRQEKYQAQADIKRNIQEAYMDLSVLRHALIARVKRLAFQRERVRIGKIYYRLGRLESQKEKEIHDVFPNEIETLKDQIKVIEMKCEFHRRLAKLYSSAGISLKLLSTLVDKTKQSNDSPRRITGLYLWRSIDIVTDKDKRQAFLDFCAKNNINKVYCFLSRTKQKELYLKKYDLEFEYFLDRCSEMGINVFGMMGEPDWITFDYQQEIKALVDSFNSFNEKRRDVGLPTFDGLHLDVEPHAFPEWHKDKDKRMKLVTDYLIMLRFVEQLVGRSQLSLDAPYTYSGIPTPAPGMDLIDAVAQYVSEITIMAYLNKSNLILKKVLPILKRKKLGVRFEVAVETAPIKENYISFAGTSMRNLLDACRQCSEKFDKYPDFAGFVFHDYTHIKELTD